MRKLWFLFLLLCGIAYAQQPPQCGGAPCTPFMPYQQPPYPNQAGLWVQTAAGTVNINNVVETIPVARIAVAPNTTTYIYLDLTQGVIGTNTSGFISGQYPIASASTNATIVTTLQDLRPNVFNGGTGGGGGGGGSSTAWET